MLLLMRHKRTCQPPPIVISPPPTHQLPDLSMPTCGWARGAAILACLVEFASSAAMLRPRPTNNRRPTTKAEEQCRRARERSKHGDVSRQHSASTQHPQTRQPLHSIPRQHQAQAQLKAKLVCALARRGERYAACAPGQSDARLSITLCRESCAQNQECMSSTMVCAYLRLCLAPS